MALALKHSISILQALARVWLALPLLAAAQEEFFETLPDGTRPPPVTGSVQAAAAGVDAARQSRGALSGRVVFTSAGHGWTWGRNGWYTQRGVGLEMNEDYGNLDQMNCFIAYVFNAGATVVAFRPVGYQTNEVVLDNDSPGVRFAGQWFDSRSPLYFGRAGAVPYRFARLDKTETATATYTPRLPAAGFYPVYTWVRHGPDRTSQLYRILHTGGQTLVRVPHQMVGNGWVYLGTYYFAAGADPKRGAVRISNLQPSPGFGTVAVADAIRFGNGMGDLIPAPGAPRSSYPREEEASLYWVRKSLGQGQTNVLSAAVADQQSGNVSVPPRLARDMNREQAGNLFQRVFLSFHSNAGGGRGGIGLWNNPKLFPGTMTPNQLRLAQLVGAELTNTFCGPTAPALEVPWFRRTALAYAREDYAFGEINNKVINDEFDATILEVAFHDSKEDAKLLRDPKVRDLVGRCSYQAIVRYMHELDGLPLQFLPEPPRNPRVTSSTDDILIAWDAPAGCQEAGLEGYLVYRSEDGYGFGHPQRVPARQTMLTVARSRKGQDSYFRVTALNAGGESLPSPVVGCRPARRQNEPRVLFVNGFTQLDRCNNPRQTLQATNYHGLSGLGQMDRTIPRLNNGFDYVVPHGKALAARGAAFDSCQRESVAQGGIALEQYETVIWAAGNQRTALFQPEEEAALVHYLRHGGNLFVSGSCVATALAPCGTNTGRLSSYLHARPAEASSSLETCGSVLPLRGSFFHRPRPGALGGGEAGYFPKETSRLQTDGDGARAWLRYADGSGTAGVVYDASAGGGHAITLGFPFECLASPKLRSRYLGEVLGRMAPARSREVLQPEITRQDTGTQVEWRSVPGRKYQLQYNALPGGVLWQNLGRPIVASRFSVVCEDPAKDEPRRYRVLVLN